MAALAVALLVVVMAALVGSPATRGDRDLEGASPAGGGASPAGGGAATPDARLPRPSIPKTDWWAVLGVLDERRARALQGADPGELASYAVAESPAWRADSALLDELARSGVRPRGLRSRLVAIESALPCRDPVLACLVVVDQRDAYTMVDPSGTVVEEVAASGTARWRITLVPAEDPAPGEPGWRVSAVQSL